MRERKSRLWTQNFSLWPLRFPMRDPCFIWEGVQWAVTLPGTNISLSVSLWVFHLKQLVHLVHTAVADKHLTLMTRFLNHSHMWNMKYIRACYLCNLCERMRKLEGCAWGFASNRRAEAEPVPSHLSDIEERKERFHGFFPFKNLCCKLRRYSLKQKCWNFLKPRTPECDDCLARDPLPKM